MAQEAPQYEENTEFNQMAVKLAKKYPEKFAGVEVDKVCCVNITNKTRRKKTVDGDRIWGIIPVKMPIAMHSPYGWYVELYSEDWDALDEKHKLALVADVMHGLPSALDNQGKVVPCDTKGYHAVFATLGLDYLDSKEIPHLLEEDVKWRE